VTEKEIKEHMRSFRKGVDIIYAGKSPATKKALMQMERDRLKEEIK